MSSPTDFPIVQWTLVFVQIVTLIALIVYVWKTWEMARATLAVARASADTVAEMRSARHAASDPRPFIYFSIDKAPLAEIIIENAGQSTAADLSFAFDPPLQATDGENVGRFFDTPKHLPPGARLGYAFDIWPEYISAKLPLQYSVTLRYRRLGEPEYRQEVQILDAAGFQHYAHWKRKDIHDVAEELHKQAEAIARIARDESSLRRKETATSELTPTSMTLQDSLAVLQGLWKAYQAAARSGKVIAWPDPYLSTMRRAAITAIARLETIPASAELKEAVQIAFIALHHQDWQIMEQRAAITSLDAALTAVADAIQKSGDIITHQ